MNGFIRKAGIMAMFFEIIMMAIYGDKTYFEHTAIKDTQILFTEKDMPESSVGTAVGKDIQLSSMATEVIEDTRDSYANNIVVEEALRYEGLKPGMEYFLEGWLIDADTGGILCEDARTYLSVIPEREEGTVIVEYNVNKNDFENRSILSKICLSEVNIEKTSDRPASGGILGPASSRTLIAITETPL